MMHHTSAQNCACGSGTYRCHPLTILASTLVRWDNPVGGGDDVVVMSRHVLTGWLGICTVVTPRLDTVGHGRSLLSMGLQFCVSFGGVDER